MAKTPKATDGEAPKKRTRKVTTPEENTTKVVKEAKAATKTAKPKAAKAKKTEEVVAAPALEVVTAETAVAPVQTAAVPQRSLEERVRIRAYELYLRRGGQGGSPEQDWFQAMAEVYRESVA